MATSLYVNAIMLTWTDETALLAEAAAESDRRWRGEKLPNCHANPDLKLKNDFVKSTLLIPQFSSYKCMLCTEYN